MEAIQLTPIESRQRYETYQVFILSSLALASLLGFVLALVLPLGRALDWGLERSRPDLIAVHGQVQVLGFAGLFIMGMALRLMPRFSGVHLRFPGLIQPLLGLTLGGLLLRALVATPLADSAQGVIVAGAQAVLLVAAVCFAMVVIGTLTRAGSRADATAYMFILGASFLVAQALLGLLIAVDESGDRLRVFSHLPSQALLHLQIAGFLLAFIGGVGTRALPTMTGIARPNASVKATAFVLGGAVGLTAAALLWAEYGTYSTAVARLASGGYVGLGAALLAIAWSTGILRPAANRLRPASQPHLWLVRSAVVWMVVAGVLSIYFGSRAFSGATILSQFEVDGVRHAIGLGVVTMLIMGMAMMIVPEFAGQRQFGRSQAPLSVSLAALLNAATFLRVAPAVAGFDWSNEVRDWSMAIAGGLAQAAILVFAWSFVRLFVAGRGAAGRRLA
jgi:hypothetical protein